jgi:putative flippase GtrA
LKRGRKETDVIPSEARNLSMKLNERLAQIPRFARNDNPIGRATRLLGKYGSTSVVATSADFAMFHVALTYLGASPVWATILGRAVGSVVAFLLHRSWVFRNSKKRDNNVLKIKYVLGILIGMALNAAGVWFLNSVLTLEAWPARIVTATAVWFFGFLFNKKIVFG